MMLAMVLVMVVHKRDKKKWARLSIPLGVIIIIYKVQKLLPTTILLKLKTIIIDLLMILLKAETTE